MSLLITVVALVIIVACGICGLIGWLITRASANDNESESFVGFFIRIPQLESADGGPIGPDDLRAASVLLAGQITRLANEVHAEAMAASTAQVAADEAVSITTEIDIFLNENGAA